MKEQLRRVLVEQAVAGTTLTYAELAGLMGFTPPGAIHRVGDLLEVLMQEDAAAGRPLLAASCVSRARRTLPARGFFMVAAQLGLFDGDAEGPAAAAFHGTQLRRVREFYRRSGDA